MGIISELDTGMRRQFDEKFKEIRSEFDKVFRELFGGGHGNLELVDGRRADYRPAARQKAAEHDAAFRRRKGPDGHFTPVRHSEPETLALLSAG